MQSLSYTQKLMQLGQLRRSILGSKKYDDVKFTFKRNVRKMWNEHIETVYKSFITKFNAKYLTNFSSKVTMAGIKFCQLLEKAGFEDGDSAVYPGESPYSAYLFSKFRYTKSKFHVSSPTGGDFLYSSNSEKMNLHNPDWMRHKNNNINDETFQEQLVNTRADWLLCDIGTQSDDSQTDELKPSTQKVAQIEILNSIYNVLSKNHTIEKDKPRVGMKGSVIKSYRIDDDDTLEVVRKIMSLYKHAELFTPIGSSENRDEVYIILKNKSVTKAFRPTSEDVFKMWYPFFERTYNYYANFKKNPNLFFDSTLFKSKMEKLKATVDKIYDINFYRK